jgi:ABC-type bacteriocin/lantibiotic exporter with double-glycine peptidase domain
MILECYGYTIAEAYLREICECDETGTVPFKVVEAVKAHFTDLSESWTGNLSFDELQEELSLGLWPIVYLDLFNQGIHNTHAVVVIRITTNQVHVLDPELDSPGNRIFSSADFDQAWSLALRRTIIIKQFSNLMT